MKKYILLTIAALALSATAFAQDREIDLQDWDDFNKIELSKNNTHVETDLSFAFPMHFGWTTLTNINYKGAWAGGDIASFLNFDTGKNFVYELQLLGMDIRYGAVYSPHVTVFRKGGRSGFALMDEPYETAFISCAALDFNEKHGKNHEYRTPDGGFTREGREIMLSKIRTIFGAALLAGHDALVLGAFGCGAFRLRPDLVAGLFRDALSEPSFKNRFRAVVFAILEKPGPETGVRGKFAPFYRVFGRYAPSR